MTDSQSEEPQGSGLGEHPVADAGRRKAQSQGFRPDSKPVKPKDRWPLFRALKAVLFDFKNFAQTHLTVEFPPGFWWLIWLTGLAGMLGKPAFEQVLQQLGSANQDVFYSALGKLFMFLPMALVFGFIATHMRAAWFYLRVRLAGGKAPYYQAVNTVLFTLWPYVFVASFYSLWDSLTSYHFTELAQQLPYVEELLLLVSVVLLFYAVIAGYRSARILFHAKRWRSVFLFLVLPFGTYIVLTFLLVNQSVENTQTIEQELQQLAAGDASQPKMKVTFDFDKIIQSIEGDELLTNEEKANSYREVAQVMSSRGKSAEAAYQKALDLYKKGSADYYATIGDKALLVEGNTEKAIQYYRRALKEDPENYTALNSLGYIYMGNAGEEYTDYVMALPFNRKAYELNKSEDATFLLAKNYYFLNMDEEALDLFKALEAFNPQNAYYPVYIGWIHYYHQDHDKARKAFRRAIALDPAANSEALQKYLDGASEILTNS